MDCAIRGSAPANVTGSILTAGVMNAHNTFANPDHVRPADFADVATQGDRVRLILPPMPVVALTIIPA